MPVVALCVVALAACGSSSSSSTSTSRRSSQRDLDHVILDAAAGANAAVVKLVPAAIKSQGHDHRRGRRELRAE